MAFLFKKAGGAECTSEGSSILDVVPNSVHERSTCWLGSVEDVKELKSYLTDGGQKEEEEAEKVLANKS